MKSPNSSTILENPMSPKSPMSPISTQKSRKSSKSPMSPISTQKSRKSSKSPMSPMSTQKKTPKSLMSPTSQMSPTNKQKAIVCKEASPTALRMKRQSMSPQNIVDVAYKKQKRPAVFNCRMSPSLLMKFIKSDLSDEQITAVKSMGFGGLLQLKTDAIPGHLAFWLVSNLNTYSCSYKLHRGRAELDINDQDVHLATGIPNGLIPIKIATSKDKSEGFLKLKQKWLQQFKCKKVYTSQILDKLILGKDGGDEFKRNFVVFIVNSFLGGVKGAYASCRILKCLENVSCVSSFNWAAFTRKQIIESVEDWQKDPKKLPFFGGPIMVLVFIYLDRIMFKYTLVNRCFPILSTWTKEKISERLNEEKNIGFGKGGIQERLKKDSVKDNGNEESGCSSSFRKLAKGAVELASAFEHFSICLTEAKLENPDSKFVREMASLAEMFFQGYENDEVCNVKDDTGEAKGHDDIDEEVQECDTKRTKMSQDSVRQEAFREFRSRNYSSEDDLLAALGILETTLGKRPSVDIKKDWSRESDGAPRGSQLKQTVDIDLSAPEFSVQDGTKQTLRRSPRFTDGEKILTKMPSTSSSKSQEPVANKPTLLHKSPCFGDASNSPCFTELEMEVAAFLVGKPLDSTTVTYDSTEKTSCFPTGMKVDQPTTGNGSKTEVPVNGLVPAAVMPEVKDLCDVDKVHILVDLESQDDEIRKIKKPRTSSHRSHIFANIKPSSDPTAMLRRSPRFCNVELSPPSFKLLSSESPDSEPNQKSILIPDSPLLCRKPPLVPSKGVKRKAVQLEDFQSTYLQRNPNVVEQLTRLERQVLDLALSESHDQW